MIRHPHRDQEARDALDDLGLVTPLHGKDVVVVADKDAPGYRHAQAVIVTGVVERHVDRALTIRTDGHGTVWTSCGHVIGAAS